MSAKARKPTLIKPPLAVRPRSGGRKFGGSVMPLHFHSPLDAGQIPPQPWRDLPPPTGQPPFHLGLESVVPADVIQRVNSSDEMVFHTVGDTGGVNETSGEENVASYWGRIFHPTL